MAKNNKSMVKDMEETVLRYVVSVIDGSKLEVNRHKGAFFWRFMSLPYGMYVFHA